MKNNKPVKLVDLISEIELQIDDTFTFINTNTGEVITLMREEMRAAEDENHLKNSLTGKGKILKKLSA